MKMVKSLLLGSATGFVAIAGAQAADLPVKAKPVEYVKICSLYGVGFYYIPGTDMCLKVGGWVRAQYQYHANGSTTSGNFNGSGADTRNNSTNESTWRTRGYVTLDARNQTPYGTVRAYMDVGLISNDIGNGSGASAHTNRGFIQWAGFTFGLATSFFEFYSGPATSYLADYAQNTTSGGGWMVAAYTAQFGNGFSGTISAEARRDDAIVGDSAATNSAGAGALGAGAGAGYGGFNAPDVVANLRVDQAWGSAQIMGALHEVNATYYSPNVVDSNGHPDVKWGFGLGAGIKLNAPMIGHGDYFQAEIDYSEGASYYEFSPQIMNNNYYMREGNFAGYGVMSDAVYGGTLAAGNTTQLELTTAWAVNAAFEHHWNDQWQTSIYGGYAQTNYSTLANAMLCVLQGQGVGAGSTSVAAPGCDNDWSTWWIGSRTQWNVTKDFYMGLDVMYEALQSASGAGGLLPAIQSTRGATFVDDMDIVRVEFRVHKDFYP